MTFPYDGGPSWKRMVDPVNQVVNVMYDPGPKKQEPDADSPIIVEPPK